VHDLLALFDLPSAPTAAGVLLASIVILYRLITDRVALGGQIRGLGEEVSSLTDKVDNLEALYDQERGAKHKAYNDVARTVMALGLVQRLAQGCSCHVLDPLTEIIDRLVLELESPANRRLNDPD
jgi:hypothetical protein